MNKKTALIFGSTGLTGSYLLDEILKNDTYEKVKIFARKELNVDIEKAEVYIIDFDKLDEYSELIKGDDLFCCLGTTIKKAGSQKATQKVDLDYPVRIAQIAEKNDVKKFIIVSSIMANHKSKNFYLKNKGKMEEEIRSLNFISVHSLRPSYLLGKRNEFRFAEKIGIIFVFLSTPFMLGKLKRYKAIHGKSVAKAMIYLANNDYDDFIVESEMIKKLSHI